MTEYVYRGFTISYLIAKDIEKNSFKADGTVEFMQDNSTPYVPIRFHTEYDTYIGAEQEIKKLLENYVDFELKSFYEMGLEKVHR